MSDSTFELFENIVKSRRTVSFNKMNGKVIPDATIHKLLELAHWAPTHGRTEPWHFFVFGGAAKASFGQGHADVYWKHTAEDKRTTENFEKWLHTPDKASHVLVAVMKRGDNPKIPQLEEIAAASAAVQNILLGATALGIASFWSTGGMVHHPAFKEHLQLGEHDIVLGIIYLGYTDEPANEGKRNKTAAEKATWS